MTPQPAILLPPPPAGHFLSFRATADARAALTTFDLGEHVAIGLAGGADWRPFPALDTPAGPIPSSQADLWAYCRGDNPGQAFDRARAVLAALDGVATVVEDQPTFTYGSGRDLTGYEDGTENPTGDDALAAAFHEGQSYVAVQRWVHDLGAFRRLSRDDQDLSIGRELESNAEIGDAPPSAHVKRSAQEDFDPAAFMLRRSMPYGNATEHGLYFVAFGADLDRFERVLRRMCGLDDGVVDALFRFSRPVTGAYYRCPPVAGGRLVID